MAKTCQPNKLGTVLLFREILRFQFFLGTNERGTGVSQTGVSHAPAGAKLMVGSVAVMRVVVENDVGGTQWVRLEYLVIIWRPPTRRVAIFKPTETG